MYLNPAAVSCEDDYKRTHQAIGHFEINDMCAKCTLDDSLGVWCGVVRYGI